jgi:hypothetical protein
VRGRVFVAGELHAQEPNWICAFAGGGIAIKEVAHGLVEIAFAVFVVVNNADGLPLGELEGGGMELTRWGKGIDPWRKS